MEAHFDAQNTKINHVCKEISLSNSIFMVFSVSGSLTNVTWGEIKVEGA